MMMPLHSSSDNQPSTSLTTTSTSPMTTTTKPLATSPSHHRSSSSRLACQESYSLYKRCTMGGREVEGFSCGVAVVTYMHCALGGR